MSPNNIPFNISTSFKISFTGKILTGDPYIGSFNFGITKTNSNVYLYMKNTEATTYNEAQQILDVTMGVRNKHVFNRIQIRLKDNTELKIHLDRNVNKSKKLYAQIKNLLSSRNSVRHNALNAELENVVPIINKHVGGKKPKKLSKKKPKKLSKKKSTKKSTSKSTPKKHIGSRGGVYIIRKGRKIYQ